MLKSILDAILVPTWLHFGSIFQVLGHLGGILGRLGGVLGRLGASKIDVERASKFDQFLKASWNAIFSAQEAPRRASAADRRRRWSRPEATGGGFRRGKQEPPRRRIQKEDGRKDSETSYSHPTRRARWAADCRRLRLGTAAPVY